MIVYVRSTDLSISYLYQYYGVCTNYYDSLDIWSTPYLEVNLTKKTWTRTTERNVTITSLGELIELEKSIKREKIIDNILN